MPPVADADVVILGAGCAGLSLASRLAAGASPLRVIALETRTDYVDDRSWCFWSPLQHDLSHLVSHSWDSWRFSSRDGRSYTHSTPGVAYQYVRSIDVYDDAVARIRRSTNVTLHTGVTARSLTSAHGGVRIDTGDGEILARHVIDTRPRRQQALLYQCFAGVEIRTDAPHGFDPRVVGLMTDMESDADGLGFVYTLPLDDRRALVEWTRFSEVPLSFGEVEAGLNGVLRSRGLADAQVVRSERGILGMGVTAEPNETNEPIPGVVVAGNAGGAVRAASGYAFLRIQRWAERCAAALAATGTPLAHPAEPFVRREMDRIFLQAVRAHPERTAEYFMALAAGCPPHRLVRFLSDQAQAGDYARLITSLPLLPFLRELAPRAIPRPMLAEIVR